MAEGMVPGFMHTFLDKGYSPEQAMLEYTRNFGALILMRDEPIGKDVDMSIFEPQDFYREHVTETRDALTKWRSMTKTQQLQQLQEERDAAIASHRACIDGLNLQNEKVQAMLDFAKSLTPGPDHKEYVDSFIKMCEESIQTHDYLEKEIDRLLAQSLDDSALLHREKGRIEDYEHAVVELQKETERQDKRKAWFLGVMDLLSKAVAQ